MWLGLLITVAVLYNILTAPKSPTPTTGLSIRSLVTTASSVAVTKTITEKTGIPLFVELLNTPLVDWPTSYDITFSVTDQNLTELLGHLRGLEGDIYKGKLLEDFHLGLFGEIMQILWTEGYPASLNPKADEVEKLVNRLTILNTELAVELGVDVGVFNVSDEENFSE